MNDNVQTPEKQKSKTKIIIIVAIVLIIIVAGIVAFSILSNPMRKFKDSIQSSDYKGALEIYEENFTDDNKNANEIKNILIDNINLKYDDYINEVISKDDMIDILKNMVEFNIDKVNETISETNTALKEICAGRENFAIADEEFNNKNWQDAITYYSNVSKDDTTYYSKAQNQIIACTDNYKKDVQEESQKYLDGGDYDNAIKTIEMALTYLPDDKDLKLELDNIESNRLESQLQDIKEEASQYEHDGDLLNAYLTIKSAISDFSSNSEELNTLLESYKEKYINSVITEVDEYINTNKYDIAQDTLKNAISKIGQNETLTEKLTDIENNAPVLLSEVKVINKNGFDLCNDNIEDSFGNIYENNTMGLLSQNAYKDYDGKDKEEISYCELCIDKKYSKFISTIAVYDGSNEEQSGIIEIYADDELVYTSPVISRKTKPFDIEINVSNVEWFKIVLRHDKITEYGNYTPSIILGNAMFIISNDDDSEKIESTSANTYKDIDETSKETESSNQSTSKESKSE